MTLICRCDPYMALKTEFDFAFKFCSRDKHFQLTLEISMLINYQERKVAKKITLRNVDEKTVLFSNCDSFYSNVVNEGTPELENEACQLESISTLCTKFVVIATLRVFTTLIEKFRGRKGKTGVKSGEG
jgi:alkyl sulfatase BDS1-like metallo-beta-lactamase superfamily hydrolase